jgi:hypothetical protein
MKEEEEEEEEEYKKKNEKGVERQTHTHQRCND